MAKGQVENRGCSKAGGYLRISHLDVLQSPPKLISIPNTCLCPWLSTLSISIFPVTQKFSSEE